MKNSGSVEGCEKTDEIMPSSICKHIKNESKTGDFNICRTERLIRDFPTTRYYGSKKRLLEWLYTCTKDLKFETVLDGFGGTASVSLLFKSMGKKVTYNDALVSNTVSARALLADAAPFENADEVSGFFESVVPTKGFISKKFRGKFYYPKENEWLDGFIRAANDLPIFERDAYSYCVFQACLQKRPFNLFHRANLNIRRNKNVCRNFGNQTTWDTPFPVLATRAYLEMQKAIFEGKNTAETLYPGDVSEIGPGYDLVYLDPPYISKEKYGDDYQRRYHFLDGMCQYGEWDKLIDYSYNNLQLKKKQHIYEWQSKAHFKERLSSLIEKHCESIVVLSYVDGAYPSIKVLKCLFKKNFSDVRVNYKKLPHALSGEIKREVVFTGIP